MVTAGAFADLPWLEAPRGTAGKGHPPDRLAMSQYPLGTRGLICPPTGGWSAGVELESPGVVQADTHKTTATNTTRMTRFHQASMVFQVGHIVVSSGGLLPSPLAMFETFTLEEPASCLYIPTSVTREMGTAVIPRICPKSGDAAPPCGAERSSGAACMLSVIGGFPATPLSPAI
jgi:hypothetical protein